MILITKKWETCTETVSFKIPGAFFFSLFVVDLCYSGHGVTVTFTIRVRKTPGSNPGVPTGQFFEKQKIGIRTTERCFFSRKNRESVTSLKFLTRNFKARSKLPVSRQFSIGHYKGQLPKV